MRATLYFTVALAAIAPALAKKHKHKHRHGRKHCPANPSDPPHTMPGPAPTPGPTETTPLPDPPATDPPVPTPPPISGGGQAANCMGDSCYKQQQRWVGADFYDDWEFFNRNDPTHGNVNYVDMGTAKSRNLTYASDDSFIMRADSTTQLKGGQGRESVRIFTKEKYVRHVAVLDVRHMPEGKGTWPAYWTVGDDWPNNGELDIIEGVNDAERNLMSLHTSGGCTQPDSGRKMLGTAGYHDCNAKGAQGNRGCGVTSPSEKSYGPNFNANGGGWYATERTEDFIKVWFWERDSADVPDDVRDGEQWVSTDKWGEPTAHFVSDSCDLGKKFGPNKFVINLTFCGDWAGNAYKGGKQACNDYVNNNPEAFANAYWDIARMSVYDYVADA